MKKLLTKKENKLYHYIDGKKISGRNPDMYGNCTSLSGNCTNLYGYCSGLSGHCSGLSGHCTGLRGDCSGLSGDLDACEISDAERSNGILIDDLIKEQP